jgi:glycogen debranching enzyme
MPASDIAITRAAEFTKPFSVAAEHGAVFGEQNGVFEAWTFPVKILSHFRISADLADYPVPIDLNQYAAQVEVNPEQTTITYSHAAFTVRQHMFSPRGDSVTGAGAVVLFEIESIRPLTLTFQFTPEMLRMWPAANYGRPSAEWVKQGGSGYYILHTDTETIAGGVAIPGAQPGVMAPYQERPQTYSVEFKLRFDPKTDTGRFYPLLMVSGASKDCGRLLAELNGRVPDLYKTTQSYYAHFFDRRLTVESPDPRFDQAVKWAEVAIDQAQVKFHDETGLVAGYYTSADSARPGYGWFFGRDTEFTLYAIDSYGDFALTREALNFLFRRQREDGKIMHEFSQTADLLDWKSTPYFYAAADSTPLLVMAMEDYVSISGDTAFLKEHWDAVKRAYAFTRAHDSDGDGIYDNSQGTGWVESWPPTMPNQEIYLAALDQQSSAAMGRLAALMKDDALARQATDTAQQIRSKLTSEYYDAGAKFFAFSKNADGSTDKTPTIYPAIAWWAGTLALPDAGPMFERWASAEFSTDWGTRDLSEDAPIYDPISYHQGTVWPLFTGWVAMAEYRAGRTVSAEAHLYQNLLLTWAQDLGGCTELLSGAFYQPLGRSSSHQTWSSAMVLTPALRGLLGLKWDAAHRILQIEPNLPAAWDGVKVHNVPLGTDRVELELTREHGRLRITGKSERAFKLCGAAETCRSVRESQAPALTVELPPVEIGLPHEAPAPGAATAQIKAVAQGPRSMTFAAQGGSTYELPLRMNRAGTKITGGVIEGNQLKVVFPAGTGYQRATVSW